MTQKGMQTSRLAAALGAFLVLLIGLGAGVSIWVLRQQSIEAWRREASAIAQILAEDVSQQMTTAYLALDAATERVQNLHSGSQAMLRQTASDFDTHQMLAEKARVSPQIEVLSILGADGELINSSRQFPNPQLSLAERDYYRAHLGNPTLGTFISAPVRNKINGRWTFYISRRVNGAAGQLIGLVVLGISTDYYASFFERVSLEGRATLTLLRDDLMILTRWPVRDDMFGRVNLTGTTHAVVREQKQKHGVIIADKPRLSEGGRPSRRMGAVRVVDKYPLIVNFAIEEDMYLGEWRRTSLTIGAVAALSMLAIMLSVGLLMALLRRRETDLAASNELKRQADAANQAKTVLLADMQRQQDELRDASERMAAVFQHAADGIIIIDELGNIESFNHAAEQIYGYTAAEVIGRPKTTLVPPGTPDLGQLANQNGDFALTGKIRIEADRMRKDGSRFPAELSMGRYTIAGRRKLILIIRDITERRRMERAKSEFISTVSHELRTPLTSIRGALGLLDAGVLGQLPAKSQRLVSAANENSKRLTRLINDLLDVQKIEAGKMDFNFSLLPALQLLQAALEANRLFGQRLEVGLRLEMPVPARALHVDPDRFQQVLANLLSNACKYSPRGETVILRALQVGEHTLRIEVADRGPGIAEEFRARIFQKFSQADSSDTRAKEGTGLGLAIAQAIVAEMDGVLSYRSAPGQGATFYFDLPSFELPAQQAAA